MPENDAADLRPPAPAKAYDAFISYSHAADGRFAPALQRGLHRYGKSWRQRRAMEVFRDETGLAVNPDLWQSILDALDGSEWFVLLASPQAAASRWVGQEIEHCVRTKGVERLVIVLTEGTLAWDPVRGDFTDASDAAHPSLRGLLDREPLIVDMAWARTDTALTIDNERFRAGVAQIAAAIRGRNLADVVAADERERRRTRQVVRTAVGSLAALGMVAVIAAGVAVVNQRDAVAQRSAAESEAVRAVEARDAAERQARVALGRELATRAVETTQEREDRPSVRAALLLAVEAYALAPGTDTAGALLTLLAGPARDSGIAAAPPVLPGGFTVEDVWSSSSNGRVSVQRDGPGRVVEIGGDTEWALPGAGFALTPDGGRAVGLDGTVVALGEDGSVETVARLPAAGGPVDFSADGSRVAYARPGADPTVVVADLETGESSSAPLDGLNNLTGDCTACVITVALSPSGDRLLVRGHDPAVLSRFPDSDSNATAWTFGVGALRGALDADRRLPVAGPGSVRFSDDGTEAWLRDGPLVRVLDPTSLEPVGPAFALARGGTLDFVDDDRALISAAGCEPPGLVAVPAMAVVGALPVDVDLTEAGCEPRSGYAAWLGGDRWILTAAGIWPAAPDQLVSLACEALGEIDPAEFREATGMDRDPESCRDGGGT